MKLRNRSYSALFGAPALALSALLSGCATAPKFPAGEAILKGEAPRFPPAPDSLRCDLELTAFNDGRKSSISAAFLAKPWTRYKLDLFGLPGMVGGSFLWTPATWTLVLFDRETYAEGAGEHVAIGNLGLREVSVHDVFSFLWGDFFPGDHAQGDSSGAERAGAAGPGWPKGLQNLGNGAFGYTVLGVRWRAYLDGKTGLVREALREDSAFRIEYAEYKAASGGSGKGRPVPGKVRLYRYRDPVLEIKVKSVEDDPHWRRDPFTVKVPKGFAKLERLGG